MGYIYKITCLPTNQIYIGLTVTSIEERWEQHCRVAYLPSHGDYDFPFHRAIRKYGKEQFKIQWIDTESNFNQLKMKERFWISFYDSYYHGYNATMGGDGNLKYDYDEIVNYYLQNGNSLLKTCQHFHIYDQVVYSALKSKNIDYKSLTSITEKNPIQHKLQNKKYLLVEENKIFNTMKEIDEYFGKVVHPNVRRCLNGITEKAYGYHWKEINIEEKENE